MNILDILNTKLEEIFVNLNFEEKYAFFSCSDRPDLSDFQTNCAMPLSKILKKSPIEIASCIVDELKNLDIFSSISVNEPGFINVKITNEFLLKILNSYFAKDQLGYENLNAKKVVIIDFSSPNIAKEMHVGHLRSTVIGESLRRIYLFAGDDVIGDNHLGDWGTNMGMVIEGIRLKFPNIKCFKENFVKDKIDDLNLTSGDLLDIYRSANEKAKENEDFANQVRKTTKMLQDGFIPYRILWKYFSNISIKDMKEIYEILDAHFDLWNGESTVAELMKQMIIDFEKNKLTTTSEGAKIVDLSDVNMPSVIIEKSDGAVMYASSDLATILDRMQKYKPNLMLYVVDYRQSLHFKQVFEIAKRAGYLNENCIAEHLAFGTMNGNDGKPFKTRSGDTIKLKELINEATKTITNKSSIKDKKTINTVAVASLKFADLINFRESSYIFDMDAFTNFEGKTGAYILYNLVRINSILSTIELNNNKITDIRTNEEKDLLLELAKFSSIFQLAYNKKAPNFIAEYVYTIAKKFSSFYCVCPINNEKDIKYKNSKIAILVLTKKFLETCLFLLGINSVEKM